MKNTRPPHGFSILELAVVLVILAALASLLVMEMGGTRENAQATAARATLNTAREAIVGSSAAPGYVTDMKYVPGFDVTAMQMRDLLDSSRYTTATSYDPIAQRGWRGPYLNNILLVSNTNPASSGLFPAPTDRRFIGDTTFFERQFYTDNTSTGSPYGAPGDRAVADQWGNPLVLQIPPDSAFTNSTPAKRFRYARLVSAGPDGVLSTPLDRLGGLLSTGNSAARGDDIVIFLNRADIYEVEEQP